MVETNAPDNIIADLAQRARIASRALGAADGAARAAALYAAARRLDADRAALLAINQAEIEHWSQHGDLAPAFLARLDLARALDGLIQGLRDLADLPDPLGQTLASWEQPNGLRFERVSVPLGVIGLIFESRPNVAAEAPAVALKAGNAVLVRPGSESFQTAAALVERLQAGLVEVGLPADAVLMLPSADRALVGAMLRAQGRLDVVIPRGGRGLVERVMTDARVPVLAHLDGTCHVYVDRAADPAKALAVVHNAKLRNVSVCGAAETLLIDRAAPAALKAALIADLLDAGVVLRGDPAIRALDARIEPASASDWPAEYLAPILAVAEIDGVAGAIAHIDRWGSHHTDAIVTEDAAAAERFLADVDSAIVLVNASTQFADGGAFGFGGEIGIATSRLHARGPVGPAQLTSFKYKVRGTGQIRP